MSVVSSDGHGNERGETVRTSVLLLAVLLAALTLTASDKDKGKDKKAAAPRVVDAGSFGVFVNGKRVGTEKFQIEQGTDVSTVTSEIKVDDGQSRAEQRSEMKIATNGELRVYKWYSTVPTKEDSTIEPKDQQLLVEHMTTADQKKHEVPYIVPLSTVILDDNFFSHRELLIWRYLATGCVPKNGELACGSSRFGVLVPRQHLASSTTVELVGRDKITIKGVPRELNKVKIDADGVQWLVWVDDPENQYKVIKMTIPAMNVEVVRE
jgi:hypothetical protein